MPKSLLILCLTLASSSGFACAQATVRVESTDLQGPRSLQKQTGAAAIRDYLQSWHSLAAALESNRTDLLNEDFVGVAKEKLAEAVREQSAMGICTHYQDRVHDLQIIFYSPDGLSIELKDTVDYDMRVIGPNISQLPQRVHAHYIVVLTPAEVRWKVRVFQSVSD